MSQHSSEVQEYFSQVETRCWYQELLKERIQLNERMEEEPYNPLELPS